MRLAGSRYVILTIQLSIIVLLIWPPNKLAVRSQELRDKEISKLKVCHTHYSHRSRQMHGECLKVATYNNSIICNNSINPSTESEREFNDQNWRTCK